MTEKEKHVHAACVSPFFVCVYDQNALCTYLCTPFFMAFFYVYARFLLTGFMGIILHFVQTAILVCTIVSKYFYITQNAVLCLFFILLRY